MKIFIYYKYKDGKMKTIHEEKDNHINKIKRGIYQENDGTFTWVTYTRSGNVKRLKTAFRKIGK